MNEVDVLAFVGSLGGGAVLTASAQSSAPEVT